MNPKPGKGWLSANRHDYTWDDVLTPKETPAECSACGHKYHTRYQLCVHADLVDDHYEQCDCTESGLVYAEVEA